MFEFLHMAAVKFEAYSAVKNAIQSDLRKTSISLLSKIDTKTIENSEFRMHGVMTKLCDAAVMIFIYSLLSSFFLSTTNSSESPRGKRAESE